MKKQVLQLCHDYHGPFVSVCRQYVEALPEADVTTIFIQGESDERIARAVGGHVLFMQQPGENLRGFKFSQIFRLRKLLGAQQFDAVVAHRYKAIYLAGIMSYLMRFPALLGVAHEHNVFKRITRSLFVTFWRRDFHIAGVSQSVTDNIAEYCPSLRREERLLTLPNVLPNTFIEGLMDRDTAREKLKLNQRSYVVGFTGRLVKKKSLHLLIQAFGKLKNQTSAELVIIGDGPLRAELEQLAETLELADRVRFVGYLTEAGRYVRAFDLFVLPSGSAEAFGLVLLEAMTAEVPVLTSTAAGPAEVVSQPSCQFAEENPAHLSEKVFELINWNAEVRAAITQENKQRAVDVYSPTNFKQKLESVLRLKKA